MGQTISTKYGSTNCGSRFSQRLELTNSSYDEDLDAQAIEEVEYQDSHRVQWSELVKGDHIYYWKGYRFSHHGIYIGNNLVIHFVYLAGKSSLSSGSFFVPGAADVLKSLFTFVSSCPSDASSCSSDLKGHYSKNLKNNGSSPGEDPLLNCCLNTRECGKSGQPRETGVSTICLSCFRGKTRSLFRYEYGVSQSNFEKEIRGGTCTTAESGSPEEVCLRAEYLNKNGFGQYNLQKLNCEDFALYCKTGLLAPNKNSLPTSGQVNFFQLQSSGEETRQGKMTKCGPKMYSRDIGVRTDVLSVAPEKVAAFLDRRDRQQIAHAE